MRWDETNHVYRPGDYSLDLRWFKGRDALTTLLAYSSGLQILNPALVFAEYNGKPFSISENSLQEAIEERSINFKQMKGGESHLNRLMMIFRTRIEGIDLLTVLQNTEENKTLTTIISLDFEERHLDTSTGVFTYNGLRDLFRNLIMTLQPDNAVLKRKAPPTARWYWDTRSDVDTMKVPVAIEWFNYFTLDWIKRIGASKFKAIPQGEIEKMPFGLIYILQEETFSYDNPKHVVRQKILQEYLGLENLHHKFPRV